jgi:hypothetical protein
VGLNTRVQNCHKMNFKATDLFLIHKNFKCFNQLPFLYFYVFSPDDGPLDLKYVEIIKINVVSTINE